jgi:hypothetical protein
MRASCVFTHRPCTGCVRAHTRARTRATVRVRRFPRFELSTRVKTVECLLSRASMRTLSAIAGGLTPPTSASGLGSLHPHLRRGWAHPHATSALCSRPAPTSAPSRVAASFIASSASADPPASAAGAVAPDGSRLEALAPPPMTEYAAATPRACAHELTHPPSHARTPARPRSQTWAPTTDARAARLRLARVRAHSQLGCATARGHGGAPRG